MRARVWRLSFENRCWLQSWVSGHRISTIRCRYFRNRSSRIGSHSTAHNLPLVIPIKAKSSMEGLLTNEEKTLYVTKSATVTPAADFNRLRFSDHVHGKPSFLSQKEGLSFQLINYTLSMFSEISRPQIRG